MFKKNLFIPFAICLLFLTYISCVTGFNGLTGKVYLINENGLEDVTLKLSLIEPEGYENIIGETGTNSDGKYSIEGSTNGTYQVTPSKAGYNFLPESYTFTVNDEHKMRDFIAYTEDNNVLQGDYTINNENDINIFGTYELVTGDLLIQDSSLTSLNGLESLKGVGGRIAIGNNPNLTDLGGLDNVFLIGNSLIIHSNLGLLTLNGFDRLLSVNDSLVIISNTNLLYVYELENLISLGETFLTYSSLVPLCAIDKIEDNLRENGWQGIKNIMGGSGDGSCPHIVTNKKPGAIILTVNALKTAFEKFAVLHTAMGISTKVITVEEICNCDDAYYSSLTESAKAKMIKDYIISESTQGNQLSNLKYLILGGDSGLIPTQTVHDEFKITVNLFTPPQEGADFDFEFQDDFYTDYYYADLAEWNMNNNSIYADEEDESFEESSDYKPEITVSRIPVDAEVNVNDYYQKVVNYMTNFEITAMQKAIVQSGNFQKILSYDISSVYWAMDEGKSVDLLNEKYTITKQYADANPIPDPDEAVEYYPSEGTFRDRHIAHLNEGASLVYYIDHGNPNLLAADFNRSDVINLSNSIHPIIVSATCNGGEFAYENFDSAGEEIVMNSGGGAIAYIGSTVYASSMLGNLQLNDLIFEYIKDNDNVLLADAFHYAHVKLKDNFDNVDDFKYWTFPLGILGKAMEEDFPGIGFETSIIDKEVQVIDLNSYKYAQKSSVLLGDMLVPVWSQQREKAPALVIHKEVIGGNTKLSISGALDIPVIYVDEKFYSFDSSASVYNIIVRGIPSTIKIGYSSSITQYYFNENI